MEYFLVSFWNGLFSGAFAVSFREGRSNSIPVTRGLGENLIGWGRMYMGNLGRINAQAGEVFMFFSCFNG